MNRNYIFEKFEKELANLNAPMFKLYHSFTAAETKNIIESHLVNVEFQAFCKFFVSFLAKTDSNLPPLKEPVTEFMISRTRDYNAYAHSRLDFDIYMGSEYRHFQISTTEASRFLKYYAKARKEMPDSFASVVLSGTVI